MTLGVPYESERAFRDGRHFKNMVNHAVIDLIGAIRERDREFGVSEQVLAATAQHGYENTEIHVVPPCWIDLLLGDGWEEVDVWPDVYCGA